MAERLSRMIEKKNCIMFMYGSVFVCVLILQKKGLHEGLYNMNVIDNSAIYGKELHRKLQILKVFSHCLSFYKTDQNTD